MIRGSVSSAWRTRAGYSMRLLWVIRMSSSTRARRVTSALGVNQFFHPGDDEIPPVQARVVAPGLSDEADEQAQGGHPVALGFASVHSTWAGRSRSNVSHRRL